MNNRIYNCEVEYYKCFSVANENENIIQFIDDQLKDMYYHNFTYIGKVASRAEFLEIVKNEISKRQLQGSSFCNVLINSALESLSPLLFEKTTEISINGFYSFDVSHITSFKTINGAIVKKVTDKQRLEDVLFCDLQHDEITLGKDFCTRRCYRRGNVYLSEGGVNSYVCYYNGNIVGNCDLFLHDNVAKIEDFAVIPQYQRKGFGTTILKSLIEIAMDKNCDLIYLVTDEEDTPKEMYKKLGFSKMAERTDLFFKL